ncbi:MAG: bifunctional folylpolyglutamate synthase/dihydrofolate synthase [Candidatus Riflebacteria bacterium]|nr:bifunctional folylpolyglutamate synthase/dihydrofolate synthase [Candidatus Riflebacteria bacterium]
MKIFEAINWILNRGTRKGPYSLSKIKYLLDELDNPQNDYACILIGGTNGKGSVSAITNSILNECEDYQIGLFTSPHLLDLRERIKVNNKYISDSIWIEGVNKIKEICKIMDKEPSIGSPAFFEVITALAFWAYRECEIDLAILEVGLGGRFDSTNACSPEVSVITNIGTDHQEFLGIDKSDIAKEKLGITRKNRTLITSEKDPKILELFKEHIRSLNGKLICRNLNDGYQLLESRHNGHILTLPFSDESIFFKLPGSHQLENLSLSLELVEQLKINGFEIPNEAIKKGIENTEWTGRLQWVGEDSSILVDGAHNSEGIDALAKYLSDNPSICPINIIYGALKDKPAEYMALKLSKFGNLLFFVSPNSSRAYTEEEFNKSSMSQGWRWMPNIESAITECKADNKHKTLVCGSLYLIADTLSYLKK